MTVPTKASTCNYVLRVASRDPRSHTVDHGFGSRNGSCEEYARCDGRHKAGGRAGGLRTGARARHDMTATTCSETARVGPSSCVVVGARSPAAPSGGRLIGS